MIDPKLPALECIGAQSVIGRRAAAGAVARGAGALRASVLDDRRAPHVPRRLARPDRVGVGVRVVSAGTADGAAPNRSSAGRRSCGGS